MSEATFEHGTESPSGGTLIQSFGFAALLIVVGVLATWVFLKRSGMPEIGTVAPLEALALPATQPVVPESDTAAIEVSTWLQFAEEAYAAGRIVDPAGDNALYYYRKALVLVPSHAEALAGVDRVVRHLVSGAESAIFRGDWSAARDYAEALKTTQPNDPRARELLARINRFEQLENLLARADRQVSAARLTTPVGDNALETYRRILEIDPAHEKAQQGIDSIVQRLLAVAQSAALAGEAERAATVVARVKAIDPRAEGLEETEELVAQWSEMVSNRHLQEQLEAASAALEAGRLTEPDEPNALRLFNAALELDPSSQAARQGKRLVVDALIERAWSEIRGGRLNAAETTLSSARDAGAESSSLVPLEDEIEYQQVLAKAKRGEFDRIYSVSELDARRREIPEYPRTAKGDGWVDLRFTVSETGDVIDAEVVASSNEVFHEAALKAVRRWKFTPRTFKDRPIPVRVGARFSFRA